jgi:signal transduction histidine kinase
VSVRASVFWGIVAAVAAILALEILSDLAVDGFVSRQRAATEARLDAALDAMARRLRAQDDLPTGVVRSFATDGRRTLARVADGPDDAQDASWLAGEPVAHWDLATRQLDDGVTLVVAQEARRLERLRSNELLLDLLDVPLFLAIAFLVAKVLARRVERPIRRINADVAALAARPHTRRVVVPAGDDELARLARSFNAMGDAVQRYIERERTFTRYASHELRTPLAAIKVQVERARAGTADTRTVVDVIDRNAQRMETVMEALHSLARSSDRDTEVTPVRSLLDEVLASLTPGQRERVTLGAKPPEVRITDGHLVRQALLNLLENALEHGTGRTTIAVHAQQPSLTLRVRDVGPGVPAADLSRLTEPFYRPRGAVGDGLGLGLSLVDVIARALDGELDLRNTGTGFEATLRLPIVVEA